MLVAGGSLLTWPFMSIARPLEFFPLFLRMLICLILLNAPKALLFQSWQSAAMAFIVCCPNAHPLTPPLHFLPLLSNKNHHLPSFKLRPRMYKDDTPEDDPIWITSDNLKNKNTLNVNPHPVTLNWRRSIGGIRWPSRHCSCHSLQPNSWLLRCCWWCWGWGWRWWRW